MGASGAREGAALLLADAALLLQLGANGLKVPLDVLMQATIHDQRDHSRSAFGGGANVV